MCADLAGAFGFSAADVEHNRVGQLSRAQVARLRRQMRRNRIVYALLAVVSAAVSVGLLLPVVDDGIEGRFGFLIGGIVAGAGALLFASGLIEKPDVQVRVAEGRAQFVEGEDDDLDGDGHVVSTSITTLLLVEGESFDVTPAQIEAIDTGHLYRVYHRQGPDPILSVEYVSPPPD